MQYITDCDKHYHVSEEKVKIVPNLPVKVEKMHLLDTLFIRSSKQNSSHIKNSLSMYIYIIWSSAGQLYIFHISLKNTIYSIFVDWWCNGSS